MTAPSLSIPLLTSERLRFVPLSFDHSEGMFRLWSHPDVCRHAGPVSDYDGTALSMPAAAPAVSDKIIDFWLRAAADGWGFRWALEERKNGVFLGILGFNALGPTGEIAYHLDPDHWGQGYMSEAGERACRWAAAEGWRRMDAFIEPENKRSVGLAERLGFRRVEKGPDGTDRYTLRLRSGD